MTQDEIIEMAQECKLIGMRPFIDGIYTEALIEFAKLVAAKAIAELESQEPVAWMHIMDNTEGIKANGAGIVSITQKRKHPFGKAGIDFSKSYLVTSTPLYTHPPQRTWVGLTDEEIYTESRSHEKWAKDGSEWFSRGSFARAIEAKLKEKNND
jgi:hypothetical protein